METLEDRRSGCWKECTSRSRSDRRREEVRESIGELREEVEGIQKGVFSGEVTSSETGRSNLTLGQWDEIRRHLN